MLTGKQIGLLLAALATCAAIALPGCFGTDLGGEGGAAPAQSGEPAIAPSGAAFSLPEQVMMPEVQPDGPSIDVSHAADGYVVAHTSSAARLKFQIICNDETYNYDLPNSGAATVFPLNMGNGSYRFRIMKNTSGNDYVEAESIEAEITLASEFAPFLIPNQYCWYDNESACVGKARELAAGATTQAEAVQRICGFVISNVEYDVDKAVELSARTGYIPDPDETLESGMGVCFDYAALGAAMLRSLGIPAKIVTGNVSPGNLYHAWIMVNIDGEWREGSLEVQPNTWSRLDLTFAAADGSPLAGDATTYSDRYVY